MKAKARIVRCDERNFSVQVFKTIVNPKTKEEREEWVDEGYYGHRLDHAAAAALLRGFDVGEAVTEESVKKAYAAIVRETKEALASADHGSDDWK